MHRLNALGAMIVFGVFNLFACAYAQLVTSLPDPAAVNCLELGGQLKPLRSPDGSESLLCLMANSEIDAWALFYGTHSIQDDGLRLVPESNQRLQLAPTKP